MSSLQCVPGKRFYLVSLQIGDEKTTVSLLLIEWLEFLYVHEVWNKYLFKEG